MAADSAQTKRLLTSVLIGKQVTSLAPMTTEVAGATESFPLGISFISPGPQAVCPWESGLASLDLHLFHLLNWEEFSNPLLLGEQESAQCGTSSVSSQRS